MVRSDATKAKIKAGIKAYHACAKDCGCGKKNNRKKAPSTPKLQKVSAVQVSKPKPQMAKAKTSKAKPANSPVKGRKRITLIDEQKASEKTNLVAFYERRLAQTTDPKKRKALESIIARQKAMDKKPAPRRSKRLAEKAKKK